jgi:translation initiation factor IF-1
MENERAVIGGNNPPPFETIKSEIDDMYGEARLWLDGAPVETQEQADALNTLADKIRKVEKRADDLRKIEAKPFDDGKAEVQARYNPLISEKGGLTTKALTVIKDALRPFLQRLEDEKNAKAMAEREAAIQAQQAALEAMRNREAGNLADQEAAEALVTASNLAEKAATKAENDKAQAKGEGRAMGLRTVKTAVRVDDVLAAKWAWQTHRAELLQFVQHLAEKHLHGGAVFCEESGFTVKVDRV